MWDEILLSKKALLGVHFSCEVRCMETIVRLEGL